MGHEQQPVLRVDLAPLLPPEHDRRLDQHDAPHGRVEARIEEGHAAEPQLLGGVAARGRRHHHLRAELDLELLHHRPEQQLLAAEVVIERAPCDAGALRDLLATRCREPVLREQVARCRQQRGTRRGRPFRLRPSRVHSIQSRSHLSRCSSHSSNVSP